MEFLQLITLDPYQTLWAKANVAVTGPEVLCFLAIYCFRRIIFHDIHVSMAERKSIADNEHRRFVGCIQAGQSIRDIDHSIISRLWKQYRRSQTIDRISRDPVVIHASLKIGILCL